MPFADQLYKASNHAVHVADIPRVDRRVQGLLPRRAHQDGLAAHGRAQETVRDSIIVPRGI